MRARISPTPPPPHRPQQIRRFLISGATFLAAVGCCGGGGSDGGSQPTLQQRAHSTPLAHDTELVFGGSVVVFVYCGCGYYVVVWWYLCTVDVVVW